MALNHLKKNSNPLPRSAQAAPMAKKLKLSSISSPGHPRVVTITAEQFLLIANRLQNRGNGPSKPVIISLPKNVALSTQTKVATSRPAVTLSSVAPRKAPVLQLDSNFSEFRLNDQMPDPLAVKASTIPSQPPLSMPILTEDEPCSDPTLIEVNSTNDQYHDSGHMSASSEFDLVTSQEVSTPSLELSSSLSVMETNNKSTINISACCTPVTNSVSDDRKNHFFKSGQLKGSARTTPMTILCQRKKRKSATLEEEEFPSEMVMSSIHSRSKQLQVQQHQQHQPTLNNAAPPLDAEDDMFINDESCHGNNNPPVWLSIMEEENSQFSAGAADNDDDLLDPSRLAAQLASIRQVASQYSFSS